MLTAFECLAKAKDISDRASIFEPSNERSDMEAMSRQWRRVAAMAAYQEGWLELNPGETLSGMFADSHFH
jgi:hypothetical protein